jgi:hypothetical protein
MRPIKSDTAANEGPLIWRARNLAKIRRARTQAHACVKFLPASCRSDDHRSQAYSHPITGHHHDPQHPFLKNQGLPQMQSEAGFGSWKRQIVACRRLDLDAETRHH